MILLLIAVAVAVAVMILLAVVVVAIRQEPRAELGTRAPNPVAAMVRRLLGLYVRRPDQTADEAGRCETCLTGRMTGADSEDGGR